MSLIGLFLQLPLGRKVLFFTFVLTNGIVTKLIHNLMASESKSNVPSWLMLLVFFLIEAALWFFGDLFTFLVGTFITILVFANGYDRTHQDEAH